MGAVFSTATILAQHYWNARQAIISATQLAQEVKTNLQDTTDYKVCVWKETKKRWVPTVAGDLIPGDIFRLNTQQHQDSEHGTTDTHRNAQQKKELLIPVDALILRGQCLTNEAILTGESVPQIKLPLDFEGEMKNISNGHDHESQGGDTIQTRRLDLHKDRSSILFAGTTLFHTLDNTENDKNSSGAMTCITLRTGVYSSKGRLLKALNGNAHVGAISNNQSEKDAIRMITSLSFCAVISCLSLFVQREGNPAKVSPFRRVIQCTRIALASIPSDMPLALASVAGSCSRILRNQADVVCSEPGSLLTAAYINTVVFDKVISSRSIIIC